MTFMLVDDSSTMRKISGAVLKNAGYDFIEAENGQDALTKLPSWKIDFFLVDVNMPVMNGLDFVSNIRTKPEYKDTPVIMLTTENDQSIVWKGKEAGADGWIVKPFKNDDLLGMIRKYTGNVNSVFC